MLSTQLLVTLLLFSVDMLLFSVDIVVLAATKGPLHARVRVIFRAFIDRILGRLGINYGIHAANDVFASRIPWQLPEQSALIFAE